VNVTLEKIFFLFQTLIGMIATSSERYFDPDSGWKSPSDVRLNFTNFGKIQDFGSFKKGVYNGVKRCFL
jgi:hypothetical protein